MPDVELNAPGAVIKTAYESEVDINAYTDAEKTKLTGIVPAADAGIAAQDDGVAVVTSGTSNIAVFSEQIDQSGVSNGRTLTVKFHVNTTDFTAKTFSARLGVHDGDSGDTLSIGGRFDASVDDLYNTVKDLGVV